MSTKKFGIFLAILALLLPIAAACVPPAPPEAIDGYVVVAPSILRSGQREAVSLSLFSGEQPAKGRIELALLKEGKVVLETSAAINGKGTVPLRLPQLAEGEYQLQVKGPGFQDQAPVQVQEGILVFLETDKPIYKPGQTVHIRVLTLDPELKPLSGQVTVEVQDAKGTKVFKKIANTDDYGMATLALPLSSEPNLGVWKIAAQSGNRSAQVDVRVEEYVLPKYEVTVDIPREWVLANEPISGTVGATYSFGKPVKGEVEIKASRYVGQWQVYATASKELDGKVEFSLPAVGYVAGVPGARGMGQVTLEVTVREKATGYQEKTTRLLTVASSPVSLQVIAESSVFKPQLPLSFLVITETPDNKPLDRNIRVTINYMGKGFDRLEQKTYQVSTKKGQALLKVTPPQEAVALTLEANTEQAHAALTLEAGYSPSGNFIHLEQVNGDSLRVGGTARFHVSSTSQAVNFYYEVLSRGKVVFSDFSASPDISFSLTPLMAPTSRLLVYQILPNSEVAADYIPFAVEGDYPHQVQVDFSQEEARPGDQVDIKVQTQGPAKVGLVAVDRSVFILAENRLNLQQVFDELERLYMKPQVELHEARFLGSVTTPGAKEIFQNAGVVVMSNKRVPEGKKYEAPRKGGIGGIFERGDVQMQAREPTPTPAPSTVAGPQPPAGLAEVQRVRQFFPETWLWTEVTTNGQGQARLPVQVPDSITTWVLRAIALSKEKGLGIAEGQLRAFQPFFLQVDLPYSAIRGEELPVRIALYNYLGTPQEIFVELGQGDGFDLLDQPNKSVTVAPNDVGGMAFTIRPRKLGTLPLKVTARSKEAADAVVKELLVEPEGVMREIVDNLVLTPGAPRPLDTTVPQDVVEGSARAYFAITGSYLTQTIEGLEGLLRMPFGCGEQNMILFAPNVFITRYLKETSQLKPEIMAKAEQLMLTGYQRELIYRRSDGSFSAFGQQDKEGSLWLTAFVLKTFAQAKDIIYMDPALLDSARAWIAQHQRADGSFEPIGFLHHQELLGGLKGNTALTAYGAIALLEAGEKTASARAVAYLEGQLGSIDDPYAMAIVAYALELGHSPRAGAAYDKLMSMAKEDEEGLHWGSEIMPLPQPQPKIGGPALPIMPRPEINLSTDIETTGYATLALLEHGDRLNSSRAARWLVSRRNAYGGFGSTQDTVVALQALTRFATGARADVDMTVTLSSDFWRKEVRITPENADVLQTLDAPVNSQVKVEARGQGQVVLQLVRRFNLPQVEQKEQQVFQINVDYGTKEVEVNNLIAVSVEVKFTPPEPMEAGMTVLDIAIPTGFAPVTESLAAVAKAQPKVKRYDVAGRKVVFYLQDMAPGEAISFRFQARVLYPVRAQAVTSQAYSYYRPEWKGETLGGAIAVVQ